MHGELILRNLNEPSNSVRVWASVSSQFLLIYESTKTKLLHFVSLQFSEVERENESSSGFVVSLNGKKLGLRSKDSYERDRWITAIILSRRTIQENLISDQGLSIRDKDPKLSMSSSLKTDIEQKLPLSDDLQQDFATLFEIQAKLSCLLSKKREKSRKTESEAFERIRKLTQEIKQEIRKVESSQSKNLERVKLLESSLSQFDLQSTFHVKAYGPNGREIIDTMDLSESRLFVDMISDFEEMEKIRASFYRNIGRHENHHPSSPPSEYEEHSQILREIVSEEKPIHHLSNKDPTVRKLIESNRVFIKYPILPDLGPTRSSLPALRDPTKKPNILKIISAVAGQDLSKVSMPCFLNEPTSAVQRLSVTLAHASLLEKASQSSDVFERMAYCLGLAYANFIENMERTKKPFNSLLGETYELINENGRCISEQVSHHPPITAIHLETPYGFYEGHTSAKMCFSLMGGLKISVKSAFQITLKDTDERFEIDYMNFHVKNLLMGTPYLLFSDRLTLRNPKTGESAYLEFLPENSLKGKRFYAKGAAVSADGQKKVELYGDYYQAIFGKRVGSEEEFEIISKNLSMPEKSDWQYNFSLLTVNLNHLTQETLKNLPRTDTRLRPDLRAYEHGDMDLAEAEKCRLEEAQRARRREDEALGKTPSSLWFDHRPQEYLQHKFNGKYWECRDRGEWPEDIVEIF